MKLSRACSRVGSGRMIAAACAVALLCLMSAAAAHADRLTPARHMVGAQLTSAATAKAAKVTPVIYNGGPVMGSNANYSIFWDPSGAPEYPAGYEAYIDRYFEDLAHDSGQLTNSDSVLTQYTDAAGEHAAYESSFAGAIVDTDPYPANGCASAPICLTEEQIRTEIARVVKERGLPSDLSHEYFLLTPPGVESCFEAAGAKCSDGAKHAYYCAYHGYISGSFGTIIYADDPYVTGLQCDTGEQWPSGNPAEATIAGGLAHEHSESVTDPELNAWYDSKKLEVADKCRTSVAATEFGAPLGLAADGAQYNELINGHQYLYQQMWSNANGACEQRYVPATPQVTKIVAASGPAAGGNTVTVEGANFTAEARVHFGEQEAGAVSYVSPAALTVVVPAGTKGAVVDVTVSVDGATSTTSTKGRYTYK